MRFLDFRKYFARTGVRAGQRAVPLVLQPKTPKIKPMFVVGVFQKPMFVVGVPQPGPFVLEKAPIPAHDAAGAVFVGDLLTSRCLANNLLVNVFVICRLKIRRLLVP